jgi:hypothetical protein
MEEFKEAYLQAKAELEELKYIYLSDSYWVALVPIPIPRVVGEDDSGAEWFAERPSL